MICLAAVFPACGEKIEPGVSKGGKSGVIKTRIMEARAEKQPLFYEATGIVRAVKSSTLSGKLMAAVKTVNIMEGDFVEKGQILVVLDDSQVGAQLKQAEEALAESARAHAAAVSGVASTKASAVIAGSTYRRYQNLLKDKSVSRQEFEEVEARNRQAEAALSQAEALAQAAEHRVRQAEAALLSARSLNMDSVIYAPYDGFITSKMVEPGDLVSPGRPLLGIESPEGGYIEIVVPETHVKFADTGKKVAVIFPALNDMAAEGAIFAVGPAADPGTHSFLVKVSCPADKSVRSGMYARVKIPSGETAYLSVPSTALVFHGQLTGIFIIDVEKKARFRIVRTGRTFGRSVEILSGLKPKDRYLVDPPQNTGDGMNVEAAQ